MYLTIEYSFGLVEKKEHKKEAKKAKLDAGSSGKLGQQQKDDEEEESLDEEDEEETSGIESSGEENLKETEPGKCNFHR